MERYRLKNIILLILALTNLFLLSFLLTRQLQENRVRTESQQQITTLFHSEKYNLELQVDRIPDETPTAVLTLTRDSKQERRLASYLLGREVTFQSEGGGILRYESSAGTAFFRTGGEFEINLTTPREEEDPEGFCIRFCRKFNYRELSSQLRSGTGTITALQYFDGHPVINSSVTFTFANGALKSVSGRSLPDSYTTAERKDCINALTALTAFLQYFSENGVICKAVTDIDLSYELQSTPATPLSLTPVWRLTTDASQQFFVNAVTGVVTQ